MDPDAGRSRTVSWERMLPVLLFTAGVLPFLPTLRSEFLDWDDNVNIVENRHIRGLTADNLRWMATAIHVGHYQPLTWFSFALDHAFWGLNPGGYHLVNVVLHGLNVAILYGLVLTLLRRAGRETTGAVLWMAAAACLIWGVNPLRVEPVAWVTARRDLLATGLLMLAVRSYLRRGHECGNWSGYAVSLTFTLLSLLSQAWGMTLPVVLLVIDRLILRKPWSRRLVLEKVPYILLSAGMAAVAAHAVTRNAAISLEEYPLYVRASQAAYGLTFYLWKSLVPAGLIPIYLLKKGFHPLQPVFAGSAVAVLGITIAAVLLRRRRPEVLAAWACYAIVVSPVLGFLQSGSQLVADRYGYLSTVPMAGLLCAGLLRLHDRASWRLPLAILMTGWITILGFSAHAQSVRWQSNLGLWEYVLRTDPDNHVAFYRRGSLRQKAGDREGALRDFTESARLLPSFSLPRVAIAVHLRDGGNPREALKELGDLLVLRPGNPEGLYERGRTWLTLGEVERASSDFEAVSAVWSEAAVVHLQLGLARLRLGRPAESIGCFTRAIAIDPEVVESYGNRGVALQAVGDLEGALRDFSEVIRRNPTAESLSNRGFVFERLGRWDAAGSDFESAIRADPSYLKAYIGRAGVLDGKGDPAAAAEGYRAVLKMAPPGWPMAGFVEDRLKRALEKPDRGR